MSKQAGFWSIEERLEEISAGGDPLETLNRTVEFERIRPVLERSGADRAAPGAGGPRWTRC